MDNFTISKTIKNKPDGLFFEHIKNYILGKNYELSLVFIGTKKSQTLNKKYRKKNKPASILAFHLSKTKGEIFICPDAAKHEMRKFEMNENEFITYLFIHGLLHLKGFEHGDKMEKEEKKIRKKFKLNLIC